jgi:hypothetical protein
MQRGAQIGRSLGAHPELLCRKNDDRLPHLRIGPDGHLVRALTYHRRGCVTGSVLDKVFRSGTALKELTAQ